jgi:hypothetical protein
MINKSAAPHREPHKAGSPIPLNMFAGNARVRAGVLDNRHGPCADLLVFQASRTVTPRLRNSR